MSAIGTATSDPPASPHPALSRDLRTAVAFVAVGGGAAVVFILLSTAILSLETGIPRWLASALCYAILVGPVYIAHHRITFRSRQRHRTALPKYMATQALAVVVSAAMAIPVYHTLHLEPLPGSVLVTVLTSIGSFVVLRLWTFRT